MTAEQFRAALLRGFTLSESLDMPEGITVDRYTRDTRTIDEVSSTNVTPDTYVIPKNSIVRSDVGVASYPFDTITLSSTVQYVVHEQDIAFRSTLNAILNNKVTLFLGIRERENTSITVVPSVVSSPDETFTIADITVDEYSLLSSINDQRVQFTPLVSGTYVLEFTIEQTDGLVTWTTTRTSTITVSTMTSLAVPESFGIHTSAYSTTDWTAISDVAKWTRVSWAWQGIETTAYSDPDTWDWGYLERDVDAARAAGLKPIIVLCYGNTHYGMTTNSYGVAGPPVCDPYPEPQLEAFVRWCLEAVRKFGTTDVVYEIWNEPWVTIFWNTGVNVSKYAIMSWATINALKWEFPEVKVGSNLIGGFSEEGYFLTGWLNFARDSGLVSLADYGCYHPYRKRIKPESILPQVNYAQALVSVPLIATEMGYSENTWPIYGDTEKYSTYVARGILCLLATKSPISIWHTWIDVVSEKYGLAYIDSSEKPAMAVVRNLITTLGGYRYVGMSTVGTNVYAMSFDRNNVRIVVAWCIDTETESTLTLPAGATVKDINGNSVTVTNNVITLNETPMYITLLPNTYLMEFYPLVKESAIINAEDAILGFGGGYYSLVEPGGTWDGIEVDAYGAPNSGMNATLCYVDATGTIKPTPVAGDIKVLKSTNNTNNGVTYWHYVGCSVDERWFYNTPSYLTNFIVKLTFRDVAVSQKVSCLYDCQAFLTNPIGSNLFKIPSAVSFVAEEFTAATDGSYGVWTKGDGLVKTVEWTLNTPLWMRSMPGGNSIRFESNGNSASGLNITKIEIVAPWIPAQTQYASIAVPNRIVAGDRIHLELPIYNQVNKTITHGDITIISAPSTLFNTGNILLGNTVGSVGVWTLDCEPTLPGTYVFSFTINEAVSGYSDIDTEFVTTIQVEPSSSGITTNKQIARRAYR